MSGAVVWASDAMVNVRMLRPITHSFCGDDMIDFAIKAKRANAAGEPLTSEHFPPEIFVKKDAKTNYEKLDDLFFAGSYWIVSGAVADIFTHFDLGKGNVYPTKVFRKDRITPIGDRWFCLNFGNVKLAYLGEGGEDRTPYIPKPFIRHATPCPLTDNVLALNSEALVGPDIWVDPQIYDTFFVSDQLAGALKNARVARPFGLKKCKIL
jgi:hypothetical protein